jgi:hypothetical protein
VPLPAGTYRLVVDEAYRSADLSRRKTTMTLYLPAIEQSAMPLHAHGIDPTELENALTADALPEDSVDKDERNK